MKRLTKKPATVKGKAVVFREFGKPEQVLQVEEREYPFPKPWQVRVKILLRPINPSDLMTIQGVYGQRPALPAVPGYEGMGVIEEVGLFWKPFRKKLLGRRVTLGASEQGNGTWQDYFTGILFFSVLPLPANIPDEQAAMLFVNPGAALVMTRHVLKLRRGDWLLQSAAGSALGQAVIRLSKLYGFRTINIVRRPEQAAQLKNLGADEVIVSDKEDTVKRVLEITRGRGVTYALDAVGGAIGSAMFEALGERGRMLVYGQLAEENKIELDTRNLLFKQRRLEGFWLADWVVRHPLQVFRVFLRLQKFLASGLLESPVGACYSLEEVATATLKSQEPGKSGKILLVSNT